MAAVTEGLGGVTMQHVFNEGRALVIGVANYRNVGRLPPTVLKDARDLADLLRSPEYCGYTVAAVRVLLDDEASCDAIKRELKALAAPCAGSGTIVIFFSGHGGRVSSGPAAGNYLLPHDFDPARPKTSGIDGEELTSLLAAIPAKRLVVFLDACHSGGTGDVKSNEVAPGLKVGLDERTYEKLAAGAGRVIVASSKTDEFSYVLSGMTNSLFTYHLLEALRGASHHRADGLVRVLDVFHHLAEEVPRAHGHQHPILKAHDVENNFPLALLRGGRKQVPGVAGAGADGAGETWRELSTVFGTLYPKGPVDAEIWSRAGGDIALLDLNLNGRAAWHAALRKARQGGGGQEFTIARLISEARSEFPNHSSLETLSRWFGAGPSNP